MTEPPEGSPPPNDGADATDPAMALADVWDLLDVLPAAGASSDMLATTIEMAAVTGAASSAKNGADIARTGSGATAGSSGQTVRTPERTPAWWWPAALAIVLASLVIGIAAGRATVPNPETGVLATLPITQHFDLLREAGSVGFLEQVATRDYPPPRRGPRAQSPAVVLADAEEFNAAIAALRKGAQSLEADGVSRETLATRRDQVLELSDEERRQLEKSVRAYQRLSAADRVELAAVARAITDPGGERLLQAARLWHQWIQVRDPADRRDVIELGTADRLECLDRWTRLDGRNDGREGGRQFPERDPENGRRLPPDFRQGPPPEYRQGPPERRNGQPRPPGPPRPRGMGPGPGSERGREGPGPDEPPVTGREPSPEETQAPPR
jgi:hypothetical protein